MSTLASAAAPAEGDATKKKSKKKLLIITAAVALALGGGGGWYFMNAKSHAKQAEMSEDDDEDEDAAHDKAADTKAADTKAEASKPKPPKKGKKVLDYLVGDPLYTVNLADEENDRYLQMGLVFEITDLKVGDELKERMPNVRSSVLLLLSTKKVRELLSAEGKKVLSAEILELARGTLPARERKEIKAVDFSTFVIQ